MSATTHSSALGAILFAIGASPAVAPLSRLRGQQVLLDLLLAERLELASKCDIAACDQLIERLRRRMEGAR
jgi:hypothetical protein